MEDLELFDFDFSSPVKSEEQVKNGQLKQAVLGFLASQQPNALATNVAIKKRKYQVAAAAFWLNNRVKNRTIEQTAVVEIVEGRERCFAECADRHALLERISSMRQEREKLERIIRTEEPNLAELDDLFSDFRTWRYERSKNEEYQELRRNLRSLQYALYHGSRLEHIQSAGVADFLYLAVPQGAIAPDEVADGWGLLYVKSDGALELIISPEVQKCSDLKRNNLALNIAEAAKRAVLFASGIECSKDSEVTLRRPPRKRKRKNIEE